MSKFRTIFMGALIFFSFQACQTYHQVEVAPVEVKPIHITIDVNVKVDKALDDFFGDIDDAAAQGGKTSSDKTDE